MRRIEPRTYETAEELEERLRRAEAEVALLDGHEKQTALLQLAKLRNYAQAKRWMETRRVQSGAAFAHGASRLMESEEG